MTIREHLDNLDEQPRRRLQHAFEHGMSQFIELPDSRFIGVNVARFKNLVVEQSAGVWATGVVRRLP